MIPKKIHYVWFGKKPLPKLVLKCIESWKKFCPDYEIIEWNESNFDINICDYVKEAYENKKWAFVSDYARFYVLNIYGGVYLDTDVEIIKPIDGFLHENFTGFESPTSVATGLIMGCAANNELCKEMLKEYDADKFVVGGNLNLRTVCQRVTELMVKRGLKLDNETQNVLNYTVYDTSYFNPFDLDTGKIEIKDNTITIHHYAGSWVSKKDKFRGSVYFALRRLFGKTFAEKVRKIIGRK